jgi:hypothetical protein
MENPIIFTIGILLIVAIIIWRLNDILFFTFRAKKTTGTIVNWMSAKSKGKQVFFPMIKFEDENGTSHKYRADESCENEPMYPIGTAVTVLYLPKDPSKTRTRYPKS